MDRSPVHLLSDSECSNESSRRFRAFGLKCPGNWAKDASLMELLERAESFHLWFEKAEKPNGPKNGGFSVVFATVEEASTNFEKVQKMVVDGSALHVQASKSFYDAVKRLTAPEKPPLLFTVDPEGEKSNRTLYAVKLISSMDKDLLQAFFDADSLESIQILSNTVPQGDYTQAEIIFNTTEQAQQALNDVDGIPIDDGEENQVLRLLNPAQYAVYDATPNLRPIAPGSSSPAKNESPHKPSVGPSTPPPVVDAPEVVPSPAVAAPEVTPEIVFDRFEEHISDSRINWAELNDETDLWKLCDDVSKSFGGLPDSLLKEALLEVLEQHHDAATTPWMRTHIESLVKLWKKTVKSEKNVPREGMVAASAPAYVPYNPPAKRNRRSKNTDADQKRALMMAGSVGQLLNHARIQFAKEDGELDIDEDEHGNFSIEGQELSFENWGKMLKKQDDSAAKTQAAKSRYSQAKYEKMLAKRDKKIRGHVQMVEKMKTMRAGLGDEDEQENKPMDEGDTGSENNSEKMTAREKRKKAREGLRQEKEKEDGEMTTDSEKMKATASSSDSSSSSESSSDEENPRRRKLARKRAAARRSNTSTVNVACEEYIQKHYVNRFNLVNRLSFEQKTTFLAILKETVQGTTQAQKNQLMKQLKAHLDK